MALVGIAAGAVLVAVPQAQDFFIKPYFWVLIAVGLFDVGAYLRGGNAPGAMLTHERAGHRLSHRRPADWWRSRRSPAWRCGIFNGAATRTSIPQIQHPVFPSIIRRRRGEAVAGDALHQHVAAVAGRLRPGADGAVLRCRSPTTHSAPRSRPAFAPARETPCGRDGCGGRDRRRRRRPRPTAPRLSDSGGNLCWARKALRSRARAGLASRTPAAAA